MKSYEVDRMANKNPTYLYAKYTPEYCTQRIRELKAQQKKLFNDCNNGVVSDADFSAETTIITSLITSFTAMSHYPAPIEELQQIAESDIVAMEYADRRKDLSKPGFINKIKDFLGID